MKRASLRWMGVLLAICGIMVMAGCWSGEGRDVAAAESDPARGVTEEQARDVPEEHVILAQPTPEPSVTPTPRLPIRPTAVVAPPQRFLPGDGHADQPASEWSAGLLESDLASDECAPRPSAEPELDYLVADASTDGASLPKLVYGRCDTATLAPPTTVGKAIVVEQSAQMLYIYQDGECLRAVPVSTGKRLTYTPAFQGEVGRYVKRLWAFGSLAEHAWYITEVKAGIYIHGLPYRVVDGERIYEGLESLGVEPVSHGCIRVHPVDAQWLASWDLSGAAILITQPDFTKF